VSRRPDTGAPSLGVLHAIAILILAHVLLAAGVLLFVAIAMLTRDLSYAEALRRVTTDPMALGAAQLAALSATIAFGVRLAADDREARKQLSLEPTSRLAILLAFMGGLALQLPAVELTTLLGDLLPMFAHDDAQDALVRETTRIDSPLRAITVPFAFVLVAPVTEELLFRGLFLPALRGRHGTMAAVVVTSVLFGLFHLDVQAAFYATAMGLLLGTVRVRAGSVLPAIALHAGFNALPIVLPEALWPIEGFNVPETDHVPAWLVFLSLAIAVAALGGLFSVLGSPREEP
jgi:membrane protease YdiL (CAAX protease family)